MTIVGSLRGRVSNSEPSSKSLWRNGDNGIWFFGVSTFVAKILHVQCTFLRCGHYIRSSFGIAE